MSKKTLISIILPCYNVEEFVEECLQSISAQTYIHWECIIINDGSTDKTEEIIKKIIERDERFSLISRENKGLSATRNEGMQKAKGSFIFFADSDDTLPKGALEKLMTNSSKDSYDIVTGITATVEFKIKTDISQLQHPKEGNIVFSNNNQDILKRTVEKGLSPVAQNRLYRREFLVKNELRFEGGIFHEDELWFFETMLKAKKVKFINDTTYFYRIDNEHSITKKAGDKNLDSYCKITEIIFQKYVRNPYFSGVAEWYLLYLKKLIIDFAIREEHRITPQSLRNFEKTMRETYHNPVSKNWISKSDESYYMALNKISVFPLEKMKKYFFKNPVNSIRKKYKLFKIKYLLK